MEEEDKQKEEEEEKQTEGVGSRGRGTVMGANFVEGGERNKLHARECEDVSVKQLSA